MINKWGLSAKVLDELLDTGVAGEIPSMKARGSGGGGGGCSADKPA